MIVWIRQNNGTGSATCCADITQPVRMNRAKSASRRDSRHHSPSATTRSGSTASLPASNTAWVRLLAPSLRELIVPDTIFDASLHGLRVLCVDNDPEILAGMRALLGRWGVDIACASTVDDALLLAIEEPEVLLVDYHLHDRLDGVDTLDALRGTCGDVPGALLTADCSDALKRSAQLRGYRVLTKPIKPASLRAFLASVRS